MVAADFVLDRRPDGRVWLDTSPPREPVGGALRPEEPHRAGGGFANVGGIVLKQVGEDQFPLCPFQGRPHVRFAEPAQARNSVRAWSGAGSRSSSSMIGPTLATEIREQCRGVVQRLRRASRLGVAGPATRPPALRAKPVFTSRPPCLGVLPISQPSKMPLSLVRTELTGWSFPWPFRIMIASHQDEAG